MAAVELGRHFEERLAEGLSGKRACLRVELPGRSAVTVGEGAPTATVTVHTKKAARHVATLNENAIVEDYLAGEIDIEGRFVDIFEVRDAFKAKHGLAWLFRFLVPRFVGQPKTNLLAIDKHYSLSPDFYLSFLDATWPAYSQGVYESEEESLAEATARKFDFVLDACEAQAGTRLLEVGPGWGAFVGFVQDRGIELSALTNSVESRRYLESRFDSSKLAVVEHDFLTYRPGRRYDLITIMGVLEHLPDYGAVCRQLRRLLRPGGYAYLDASASRVKFAMSEFIYKHIFPFNHSFLHLPSFLDAAIAERLAVVSVHDDSRSYRYTIETWARNFERHYSRLVGKFGEYHARRFRLYLWASAHAFARDELQCYRLVVRSPAAA